MSHNHTPVNPYHPSGSHVPPTVTKNKLPLFIKAADLLSFGLLCLCGVVFLVAFLIASLMAIDGDFTGFMIVLTPVPFTIPALILKILVEIWKKLDSPVKEHGRAENI